MFRYFNGFTTVLTDTLGTAKSYFRNLLYKQEESNDDDCDFCIMFGVNECCLHRTTEVFGMGMMIKTSITNSDKKCNGDVINYDGYSFRAVFSNTSNRWV